MILKNISAEEQKVMMHTGASFSCAPGVLTPELDALASNDLLGLPSIWEPSDVKQKKTKKAGDK